MAGSLSMVTTEVSLAKVAVVDSGEHGRSAVYNRYNNDPRTLLIAVHNRNTCIGGTCIGYPSVKQCFYGEGDNSSGEIRGHRG
jgi:hypothetical protein